MGLHPLFVLQRLGLLGGAFFCAVFGFGRGCYCRESPTQTIVSDDFAYAQDFGRHTIATQRGDMGVAILSRQYTQQRGAQDVNNFGGVGTGVA